MSKSILFFIPAILTAAGAVSAPDINEVYDGYMLMAPLRSFST